MVDLAGWRAVGYEVPHAFRRQLGCGALEGVARPVSHPELVVGKPLLVSLQPGI